MCIALLAYVTGMAIYFVPRNHEMSSTEKAITVVVAYGLVIVLWFAMQYREKIRHKREDEE
jgi:positive regulator of sigma E activity